MDGLLKEHGPFIWGTGTYAPIENPWSCKSFQDKVKRGENKLSKHT